MYAAGKESPQRLPCQRFLSRVVDGSATPCCTNAEVLQEVLHRYRAIGVPATGFGVFDAVVGLRIPILPIGEDEVRRARRILETFPKLSTRDAVHVGVMEAQAIKEVLTYDRGFETVTWVRRIEP